ncbi:hypothetical protein VU04_03010 [Desulfobulbus sp. TB]|nr:hypothetical protein [Desulfobulbus sp. TB]
MKTTIWLATALMAVLLPLQAETAEPFLVKDISTFEKSSSPYSPTEMDGLVYFLANDVTHGDELWRSDGTEQGTFMVKDITPGADSWSSSNLTKMNGLLYFTAGDDMHGWGLWHSDGTEQGTLMVKDIQPDFGGGSFQYNLTVVNGLLYFGADDGIHGEELWRSDGTEQGTFMVKNIRPETDSSSLLISRDIVLTEANNLLYFNVDDGIHGEELWRSDGTEQGTFMVKDIHPGAGDSYPYGLTEMNGVLYFSAHDGTHSQELWRSDGTEQGTFMVKDISTDGSFPSDLVEMNGLLYFIAGDSIQGWGLWRSDGTEQGTFMVNNDSYPYGLTEMNGMLYFSANDGTHGKELWRSDGTKQGTFMVKNVGTRANDQYPFALIEENGLLYFSADGTFWRSDGTAAGTFMIKDIQTVDEYFLHPDYYFNKPRLTEVNNLLYFCGDDGTYGEELWAYVPWHGFVVAPSADPHGSISPDMRQMIEQNGIPVSFTVTPDAGYLISSVTGCDGTLDGNTYTTSVITASCEVTANFEAIDNDGDGIGDSWEMLYFSNLTTADATSDYDQDNYSDLQEYLNWFNEKLDPKGNSYDPKEKNVSGGEGYRNPNAWLPAVLKLLLIR